MRIGLVGYGTAVREGNPPPVTAEDAIRTLEVLDAARESATTRRVVSIGQGR